MESRAKILGHSVQQTLIVFPLGLLLTAVGFDIAYLITKNVRWLDVSFWTMSVGVISGMVAAVFGIIDWTAIPMGTRAKWIGAAHGVANFAGLVFFALSLALRGLVRQASGLEAVRVTPQAFWVGFLAAAILLLGGWLGGELVDRLGVGVDEGANLNAPNSLTRKRAVETTNPVAVAVP